MKVYNDAASGNVEGTASHSEDIRSLMKVVTKPQIFNVDEISLFFYLKFFN
jgi:hypothetical protein